MTFLKDHMNIWEQIVKQSQEKPLPKVDPSKRQQLLNQLFDNLNSEINSLSGGNFTSNKDNSEVFFKDISSIDNLLYFLYSDAISFNGKRLVIGSGAQHGGYADPSFAMVTENPDEFAPYPTPKEKISFTNNQGEKVENDKFNYYIHKQYVADFLKNLLNQDSVKNNNVLKSTVSKLIDSISKLPGIQESKKEEVTSQLLPTDLLDWWSTPNINLSQPEADFMYNQPTKPVTALRKFDVDNINNFKQWLEKTDPYVEASKGRMVNKDHPEFNNCSVMQGLYKRSLLRGKVPNAKSTYYQQAIKNLVSQFNDSSGKPCSLSISSTPTTQTPTSGTAGAAKDVAKKFAEMRNLPYQGNEVFNTRLCTVFVNEFYSTIQGSDLERGYSTLVNNTVSLLKKIEEIAGTESIPMTSVQGSEFGSDENVLPRFGTLMSSLKAAIANIDNILRAIQAKLRQSNYPQFVSRINDELRTSKSFYDMASYWQHFNAPRVG